MGYALLVFPPNPQAGQVLKSIVKVLTGELELSNLEGIANSPVINDRVYSSEIYNPSNHTWTLEYPTALPNVGNFNIITATLKSECITPGKFKRIRLSIAPSSGIFIEPSGGTSTDYSLTTNYRIYAQGLSSINSSGNATNLTYRNSDGSSSFISKGASTNEVFIIKMSWSNRHIFCTPYLSVSGASTFFGCFEYDENYSTQYSNSAPCLHITGYGSTSTLGSYSLNDAGDHNVVSILGTYNLVSGTTQGVRAITTTSTMHMDNISTFGLSSSTSREYSLRSFVYDKKTVICPAPLIIDDSISQGGIINCSKYSRVFLYFNYTTEFASIKSNLNGSIYKTWRLFNFNNSSFSTIVVPYL